MRLKVFSLRYSDEAGGFDDSAIQEFLHEKDVVDFNQHFFVHDKLPHLLLVVSYREVEPGARRAFRSSSLRSGRDRPDPGQELDAAQRVVYDALRAWRTTRARQDGVPAYVVANNRHLATMVTMGARTKEDLRKVEGFGEEKSRHYGDELLEVLARATGRAPVDESSEVEE